MRLTASPRRAVRQLQRRLPGSLRVAELEYSMQHQPPLATDGVPAMDQRVLEPFHRVLAAWRSDP